MKRHIRSILVVLALTALGATAHAEPNFIGYSGAPGSHGRCASSCHGSSNGTVEISGFPTEYTPEGVYTVTISHVGGSSIRQFNGSCRLGAGSTNAGLIAGGTSTVTYSTGVETNGIRFVSQNHNSGDFLWTAPASGAGEARLYIAGHQGSFSGPNTDIVLVSTEQTSDVSDSEGSSGFSLGENFPNPFSWETTIGYVLPRSTTVLLEFFDISGRRLDFYSGTQAAGSHQFVWVGSTYPSGTYFYRLQTDQYVETKRMQLSK